MIRSIPALTAISIVLAGCAASPEAAERAEARTRAELAKELAGRTAGEPVRCLRNYQTTNMNVIDDETLLFREGRTIYLQKPRGACHGLANHSMTLVTKPFGTNQLCSGDINELVDLRSGMRGGACVFSEFIPYTRPE